MSQTNDEFEAFRQRKLAEREQAQREKARQAKEAQAGGVPASGAETEGAAQELPAGFERSFRPIRAEGEAAAPPPEGLESHRFKPAKRERPARPEGFDSGRFDRD